MINDDVLSSDVNIDVNNNSLRDVRSRTFWRPHILRTRPQESVNKLAPAHVCEWGEGNGC